MGLIPLLNKSKEKSFAPAMLSGGINLKDNAAEIADNQLSYALNMWHSGGALKTRPATAVSEKIAPKAVRAENVEKTVNIKNSVTRIIEGELYKLRAYYTEFKSGTRKISFDFVSTAGEISLKEIELDMPYFTACNIFAFGNYIYCFVSLKGNGTETDYRIYKVENTADEWQLINKEDIYAPLIIKGCRYLRAGNDGVEDQIKNGAEYVEGYNLIGSRYRMLFSTVNTSLLSDEVLEHFMSYRLLFNIKPADVAGRTITAKITNKFGQVYAHSITLTNTAGWQCETVNRGDNIYMGVFSDMLCFFTDVESMSFAKITADKYKENDMEVSIPYKNSEDNCKKIFNMSFNEWFGGGSDGIYTVTRLFLGGNMHEPSLIAWSSVNNPLYFSENCTTYIGEPSQKVTAFAKQNDVMLAFKEREILAVTYSFANDYTNKNLASETSFDAKKTFPVIGLVSGVGCTLPDTVRVINNNVIWLCGNRIYTLVSNSDYSKNTVYDVSKMLHCVLKRHTKAQFSNAKASEYGGNYLLFVENNVYVINCNCYGFSRISAVNKNESAVDCIESYIWQVPVTPNEIFTADGEILIAANENVTVNNTALIMRNHYLLSDDEKGDTSYSFGYDQALQKITKEKVTSEIYCEFATKQYGFNLPDALKKVSSVSFILLENGTKRIKVNAVTENGIHNLGVISYSTNSAVIKNKCVKLYPALSPTRCFGISASGYGRISVCNICFNYKT